MGYDVRVDVDRVDALASRLDQIGADLAVVAHEASRAWQLVAGSAGGGELGATAADSARTWGAGLDRTGRLTGDLARVTREAGEAYREVEQHLTRVWTTQTGMTGRRAGWAP